MGYVGWMGTEQKLRFLDLMGRNFEYLGLPIKFCVVKQSSAKDYFHRLGNFCTDKILAT